MHFSSLNEQTPVVSGHTLTRAFVTENLSAKRLFYIRFLSTLFVVVVIVLTRVSVHGIFDLNVSFSNYMHDRITLRLLLRFMRLK